MASVRRRTSLPQQLSKKGGGRLAPPSLQNQFMTACVHLNETRFRELVGRVRLIGTTYTVNQTDYSGRTPLSHLCGHGSTRCVEDFARLKLVDVNQPDHDGNTPLHYAAQAGHEGVVEALLTKFEGIRLDVRNRQGLTPLVKACCRGRTLCAKLLLKHGADPSETDSRRHLTAAQWAYLCGFPSCGRAIEAHLLRLTPTPGSDSESDSDSESESEPTRLSAPRCFSEPALPVASERQWLDQHYVEVLGTRPGSLRRARSCDYGATYTVARPDTWWAAEELPQISVTEVEAPVDAVVVRYGDPLPPPQTTVEDFYQPATAAAQRVSLLCLPGGRSGFAYE